MSVTSLPAFAATPALVSAPWGMQVSRGQVANATPINIFAYNPAVTTSFIPLWENTATYAFPASASVLTLVSTSASDNTSCTVLISGLDASWNLITESKTLNGLTNVTTTNAFLRINSMVLTSPGTSQTTNVGIITAKIGATTYGQINAGIGKSQNGWYSVPNGYTLYIQSINAFSGDANGTGFVNYKVTTTNNVNNVTLNVLQTTFQLQYQILRSNPLPYTQKTDVLWLFSVNSGTHAVGLILEAVLIPN